MAAIAPAVCAADADKAWPERTVRIITATPGSSPDVVARSLADVLRKRWKQPVIVENRSAGADMILVARGFLEAQDGHALLLAPHSLLTVNPVLHGTLPYDPERDFAPISLVVEDFLCVAVAIARRQLARRAGETSSHQAG
jgi:tripartite-type tricarboxylate transporter receptor subunit TctC